METGHGLIINSSVHWCNPQHERSFIPKHFQEERAQPKIKISNKTSKLVLHCRFFIKINYRASTIVKWPEAKGCSVVTKSSCFATTMTDLCAL